MALGMQRNLHIPLYHIKPQYLGSSLAFSLQTCLSLNHHQQWRAALGIPGLHVFDWEHSPLSLSPLPQKHLFLSIPRALTLEIHVSAQEQMCFLQGFTKKPLPGQLLPAAPSHSSWAPSLLPTSFHLQIWKTGGKIIPRDLTLPHDFRDGSLGLQMTFPQGTAAAKGFWILFCLHTERRPGTAASPCTDPSGQHQFDWLSLKSHQALMLWQESDLE